MALTLTVEQIKDLAEFAGLTLNSRFGLSEDELASEITIDTALPDGVVMDNGDKKKFSHVAWFADYPDEGCCPLGPELKA